MAYSIARTVLLSGAAAALVASAGACSFTHSSSVSKNDVADQIAAKMTDAQGQKPESVSCPGDLPAKVGAQLNCKMKVNDKLWNVNVTVTSVNGSDVKFDMVKTRPKDDVANAIRDNLYDQGIEPVTVTCPEDLKGFQGSTLRCQLTREGRKYAVQVTVTNPQDLSFDFHVDNQPE